MNGPILSLFLFLLGTRFDPHHRLQVESARLQLRAGLAAARTGSVAVRAQVESPPLVPEAASVAECGYQDGDRQICRLLRACPGADTEEWRTRDETFAHGGALDPAEESISSLPASCHSCAHDEHHLPGMYRERLQLWNPFQHSHSHSLQVVSFDGSTTIEEFQTTLAQELGTRDAANGFCLFSDDPIEKDLEHYLEPLAKLCDVISKWETALREKGSGKFENSRVIQLSYKNRLYWKHTIKCETDKERLLLCYQTNAQIVQGRFPLSRELALELASLMSQIDMGDYSHEKSRDVGLKALDKFYPYRYRDALGSEQLKDVQELLISKWTLLKGRSTLDCVRIYLTCCRKWPYFGACLFQAKPRQCEPHVAAVTPVAWLAVAEDALNVLELSTMAPVARYPYSSVMTFGGCQDDFMLVVSHDDGTLAGGCEQKLLFAMSKPKILEITLLIADYMNALGHTVPGTPQMNSLTRNGSHRSLRTSQRPIGGSGGGGVGGLTTVGAGASSITGFSTNATTTAHNTLNSHATHTLNSTHSHTLSSSHHAGGGGGRGRDGGGGSHQGTLSSHTTTGHHDGHHHHHHHQVAHQPDILKSTPDHQRIK